MIECLELVKSYKKRVVDNLGLRGLTRRLTNPEWSALNLAAFLSADLRIYAERFFKSLM